MNDDAQTYIRLWRRVVVDFLGRTEAELDAMIDKWRAGLAGETLMFYHEPPEYYVGPLLVPDSLARTLFPTDCIRLWSAIYPVIGRYDLEGGLARESFESMRQELERAVSEWLVANQRGA